MATENLEWNQRVIGSLFGEPVIGEYCDDEQDAENYGAPRSVVLYVENGSFWVQVDRHGKTWVGIPHVSRDGMTLADFGRLRELVSGGVIEGLLPFAQAHATSPRLDVKRPTTNLFRRMVLIALAAAGRAGATIPSDEALAWLDTLALAADCRDDVQVEQLIATLAPTLRAELEPVIGVLTDEMMPILKALQDRAAA
jgi:hypothetical protein